MKQMQASWSSLSLGEMSWNAVPTFGGSGARSAISQPSSGRSDCYLAARLLEGLSLLSIWWSAQTAVWVACGLGGLALVFLNWLLISRIALLLPRLTAKTQVEACAELLPENGFGSCESTADHASIRCGLMSQVQSRVRSQTQSQAQL